MPVSNGRFSKPIRLKEDLANFFGLSANLGYIIKNASINPHSKRKPIEYNKPTSLTDSDFKMSDGSYGLKIVDGNGSELSNNLDTNIENIKKLPNYNYTFVRPVTWFRALDFDGYYHYATPFIFYAGQPKVEINLFDYSNAKTNFSPDITTNDNYDNNPEKCVSLVDLADCTKWTGTPLGKFYLCCFFVKNNGFNKVVCDTPIENGGYEVSTPVAKTETLETLGLGTYTGIVGICNESGDRILPVPKGPNGVNSFELTILSEFNGTCVVQKIGSYYGDFSGVESLIEGDGYITNWQNTDYYDQNQLGNNLKIWNRTGVCFKLVVTMNKSLRVLRTEFGIKAFPVSSASEYGLHIQLQNEDVPTTDGYINFQANTPMTMYVICTAGGLFSNGYNTAYQPQLLCRGAVMEDSIELYIVQ